MRRFEFSDGKSNKFWEITLDGNSFTVRYGRMGTDGQTNTKVFEGREKAHKEFEKAIKSKTKKGYQEVEATAAPVQKKGSNPELEAAILADPSDPKAWAVFADWLQSQGDPRGDLMAVQIARGENPADEGLTRKHFELLEKHGKALLGDFRPDGEYEECSEIEWKNGFWQRARIWVDWDSEEVEFTKMLGALLRHPSARFLESLELGLADCEGENYYQEALDSLVKHGKRPGLRKLHVGAFEYPDETEISWTEVGSFAKCWTILPDLEELTITGGSIELGTPDAPKLKKLKLETGGLDTEPAAQLAKASLPALEDLEVWFGTDNYGGACSRSDADAILANTKGFPKVKRLGLMNADFQNEICEAVVAGALTKQVTELDLSMGTMTDDGAQILLDNAGALAHVESLNLDENYLTEAMATKLSGAFKGVSVADQDDLDDYGPYVSVGE